MSEKVGKTTEFIFDDNDSSSAVNKADIDAVVSKMFDNGVLSRADSYIITAINGKDGGPSIYVVNYTDGGGYVLLSATKNYYPILAYSDKGNFNGDPFKTTGLSCWQDAMIENVERCDSLPADSTVSARKRLLAWI